MRWAARLKLTGLTVVIVAAVALLLIWGWVLWEVKAPVASTDTAKAGARPGSPDCASLVGVLTGSDPKITPEIRERFRQCFQKR